MIRPASIVRFEQLYLGSLVVGLINTALSWSTQVEMLQNNPAVVQLGPNFLYGSLIGAPVLAITVTLLLWYFTARKGSAVTKWIITIFAALGVVAFLFSLMSAVQPTILMRILGVLALVLDVASVVFLFQPDTKAWFGETPTGSAPTDTL